jgi:hypothetical protein
MSIDGTRKPTKGWEINSSGKMVNLAAGDGIVIDEAAPIVESAGMPITDSAVVKTEPPPVPNDSGRGRRSTLDFFNDEMAVLDRPLEGAVEYADEAPGPSRWRRIGMFAAVVAVMGIGGGVVLSRRHAAVDSGAQVAQPATPSGAAAPAVIATATATTPAPAAGAPDPAAAADDGPATEEAADDAAAAPSPAAADKVKAKSGHGKHSRSASSKSTHHHASKRSVSSKRSSSRRH